MSWKLQAISSFAQVGAGQGAPQRLDEFDEEGHPFVRAGSLERLCVGADEDSLERIPDSVAQMRRMILYPAGTLLFAKSGMSATLGRIHKLSKPCYVVNHLATINAHAGTDADFLAHFFRFSSPARLINDGAYPSIRLSDISAWEIPLPPLEEQKRIAAVLDKAETLRRQRRESLQLIEKLLQSVFIDIFGDLTGADIQEYSFGELALPGRGMFSNGPFGSDLLTSELKNIGVPVVYIRDIRNGEFAWKSNVFVSPEKAVTLSSCEVKPSDLLIAKVGDPPGVAALYPPGRTPAVVTQDVIRVRVNTAIVQPVFLQHFLNSENGRHLIKTITVKGTRSRFSLGHLKKLKIPIPRPELQAAFVDAVTRILELRQSSRDSDESLGSLFSSVQQRAFRGQLDLSRLILEEEVEGIEQAVDKLSHLVHATLPDTLGNRRLPKAFQPSIEVNSELRRLDAEVKKGGHISWSPDYLLYRILPSLAASFTFDDVINKVKEIFEEPPHDDIRNLIFELLGDSKKTPALKQRFDCKIDEATKAASGSRRVVFDVIS